MLSQLVHSPACSVCAYNNIKMHDISLYGLLDLHNAKVFSGSLAQWHFVMYMHVSSINMPVAISQSYTMQPVYTCLKV